MRDYAVLSPTFWTGDTGRTIIRTGGLEGALMALYLVSSPLSNMLGLFTQPLLYASHDTGTGLEGATKGLKACIQAGFCAYDETSQTVWVYEMASWQIAKELNEKDNRCAGIQKAYDALPNSPFLGDFFDRYQRPFHMKRKRENKGAPKPLGSQDQDQDQEHNQERAKNTSASAQVTAPVKKAAGKIHPVPELFVAFWNLYPRKVNKADAIKAFGKLTATDAQLALDALPRHVLNWQALGTEDKFIPHASRWLNAQKWTDELQAVSCRTEKPKQSRQGAIFETLAHDHRYAETAERLAGTSHPQGLHPTGAPLLGLRAGGGHDPDDADCVDADFSDQGH